MRLRHTHTEIPVKTYVLVHKYCHHDIDICLHADMTILALAQNAARAGKLLRSALELTVLRQASRARLPTQDSRPSGPGP